eukprot:gene6486-10494_t
MLSAFLSGLLFYLILGFTGLSLFLIIKKYLKRRNTLQVFERLHKTKNLKKVGVTPFQTGLIINDPVEAWSYLNSFNDHKEPLVFCDSLINDVILVQDAEAVKQITIKQNWRKSPVTRDIFTSLLGYGLVGIEGDFWKKHRSLVMPSFSQANLKKMTKPIINQTKKYLNEIDEKGLVLEDFTESISQLALSVILKVGFGTNDHQIEELAKDFQKLTEEFLPVLIGVVGVSKLFTKLPFPFFTKFYNRKLKIQNEISKIIENKRIQVDVPTDYTDLLSILMDATDEDGANFTKEELFDECLTFLFAGHDTTSGVLSYLFFQFAKNPKLQQEVYGEINKIIGNEDPNEENVKNLTLLHYCMKEALRMGSPAPFLARFSEKDQDLIGYGIPANTTCFINVIAMHHNPRYWENPMEFNPRRWETIDEKTIKFCYFPFSVGPRDCAGRNLALLEADLVTVLILQKFFVKFPKGFDVSKVRMDNTFVVKLKHLAIEFEKRK